MYGVRSFVPGVVRMMMSTHAGAAAGLASSAAGAAEAVSVASAGAGVASAAVSVFSSAFGAASVAVSVLSSAFSAAGAAAVFCSFFGKKPPMRALNRRPSFSLVAEGDASSFLASSEICQEANGSVSKFKRCGSQHRALYAHLDALGWLLLSLGLLGGSGGLRGGSSGWSSGSLFRLSRLLGWLGSFGGLSGGGGLCWSSGSRLSSGCVLGWLGPLSFGGLLGLLWAGEDRSVAKSARRLI